MASVAAEKTPTKGPDAVDGDTVLPIPNLLAAQYSFTLSLPAQASKHEATRTSLLKAIEEDGKLMLLNLSAITNRLSADMGPFLESLPSSLNLGTSTDPLLASIKVKNEAELKKLDEKIEDAKTNLGETEISEALKAKATYLARIGSKVRF